MKKLVNESLDELLNEGTIKIPSDFVEVTDRDNSKPGNYIITFDAGPKRKFNLNAGNVDKALQWIYDNTNWGEGSFNMMLNHVDGLYYRKKSRDLSRAEWDEYNFRHHGIHR
jgi:hypothetical protein